MPNILDIRRRIRSVKNTQQITRAMKMVAAARLRRAQERVLNARPYANELVTVLASLAARTEQRTHPLLVERPVEKIALVFLTRDRGLAGAFNANLIRAAQAYLYEHRNKQVSMIAVGRKGRDFFRKQHVDILSDYVNISGNASFGDAQRIAAQIIELYSNCTVDAVDFIYNEFKSILAQRLVVERILPVKPFAPPEGQTLIDYIYQQPLAAIFSALLPRYVEIEVHRALLESQAAGYSAQMTAMESATNNAAEMIDSLTLYMNRVRQAAITKEIIEIVSGGAAT